MANILAEKIRNVKLTNTQRKIADYFIENQERLGSLTSIEVANEIGVSDASVIRFSRQIGYEGFADLKEHIYDMLVENALSGMTLAERMDLSEENYRGNDVYEQLEWIMQRNLTYTFKNNNLEKLNRVVDAIIEADQRYVIGLRGCKGTALSFSRLLTFIVPNVTCLIDGECTSISAVQDIGRGDVLLMFVFTRVYKIDYTYLELARKRGATIVMIMNDEKSPLYKYADIPLIVSTTNMSFFNSKLGAEILAECIITLVGRKMDYRARLEERDALTEDQRV